MKKLTFLTLLLLSISTISYSQKEREVNKSVFIPLYMPGIELMSALDSMFIVESNCKEFSKKKTLMVYSFAPDNVTIGWNDRYDATTVYEFSSGYFYYQNYFVLLYGTERLDPFVFKTSESKRFLYSILEGPNVVFIRSDPKIAWYYDVVDGLFEKRLVFNRRYNFACKK